VDSGSRTSTVPSRRAKHRGLHQAERRAIGPSTRRTNSSEFWPVVRLIIGSLMNRPWSSREAKWLA
jgi:hypothetical protein